MTNIYRKCNICQEILKGNFVTMKFVIRNHLKNKHKDNIEVKKYFEIEKQIENLNKNRNNLFIKFIEVIK